MDALRTLQPRAGVAGAVRSISQPSARLGGISGQRRGSHSQAPPSQLALAGRPLLEENALRKTLKDNIWSNGFDTWPAPSAVCQAVATSSETAAASASVIDGKQIAEQIKWEVKEEVDRMRAATGQVPGLAVVLVGERKDSQTYVRSKKKACEDAGIASFGIDLPEDATEEEVVRRVQEVNNDERVHGVLVQLPLPKHINEERVLGAVSLEKDVDGFHPINIGQLAMAGREPLFVPCTPKGCIELLLRTGVEISGKRAVVIGRSNIVGTPAAMLLQRRNATVTVVHSRTKNPEELVRQADIVIAAVGVAELVRGDWLKPGCVVIDVGINAVDDPSAKRGYRLAGDVCYDEAAQVASAITPVPGGVGPMTIAMLLTNTLEAAKRAYKLT